MQARAEREPGPPAGGHVERDWFQALRVKGCTLNGDVDVDIHSGLRPEVAGDV
jgi:hypothetical protein